MKKLLLLLFGLLTSLAMTAAVTVGAERTEEVIKLLRGKRVALLSNHTGIIGPEKEHTLDMLLRNGIEVTTIFSPEHGFRGTADAGAHVKSSVDPVTGIPIASLFDGKGSSSPSAEVMDKIDVIVTDLQDVGVRFYTYYITMLKLMNVAAAQGKEFVVLDRPNPIGMMVDGPVLDMKVKSGVGALPLPIAHGLTLGEMAMMINGEGWLDAGRKVKLEVVPCQGYTHATRYKLPVNPSPNLKSMKAIYLYPSTCLFEGTVMSLGRGTDHPFEIYGHPDFKGGDYSFTPRSMPGAQNPPLKDRLCRGRSLQNLDDDEIIARGVDPTYLLDAYYHTEVPGGKAFFINFLNLLYGKPNSKAVFQRMKATIAGKAEKTAPARGSQASIFTDMFLGKGVEEIKASWQPELEKYRKLRQRYLLYPEK